MWLSWVSVVFMICPCVISFHTNVSLCNLALSHTNEPITIWQFFSSKNVPWDASTDVNPNSLIGTLLKAPEKGKAFSIKWLRLQKRQAWLFALILIHPFNLEESHDSDHGSRGGVSHYYIVRMRVHHNLCFRTRQLPRQPVFPVTWFYAVFQFSRLEKSRDHQ